MSKNKPLTDDEWTLIFNAIVEYNIEHVRSVIDNVSKNEPLTESEWRLIFNTIVEYEIDHVRSVIDNTFSRRDAKKARQ